MESYAKFLQMWGLLKKMANYEHRAECVVCEGEETMEDSPTECKHQAEKQHGS